ncbi:DEAD/DEAH box helicase [Phenylobacterium sp.]|uniref:DEAD/DEAH box helicase n=1 Tax=Phenylobacterium sp. TaxID=1871053 RepID=UPI0035B220D2
MTQFSDLGLSKPLLKALADKGYDKPTPIQAQAIPGVLAGRDLLGIAQTGTGKTAAFALPILHRLAEDRRAAPRRGCRCLVLSPTRELATQIADSFKAYGRHLGMSVAVIFGGVKYGPQMRALAGGVDILVATPGRLIDHLGEKSAVLTGTEIFVLDEADQMLDMGFVQPIKKIVAHLPKTRQNLFFSATMPAEIGALAGGLLHDPLKVSVTPQSTTVERVNQQVVFVEQQRKRALLAELFDDPSFTRVIVFTRTKRGADRVAKGLVQVGVEAASIHGDKSQGQRERALAAFKAGEVRALVATDIAARGIDIDSVTHVVQYELPNVPESYVHRIGRTARAGAKGSAVAFCADDERNLLRDIQKVTRQTIPSFDRRNDRQLGAATAALPEVTGVKPDRPDTRGQGGRSQRHEPHHRAGGHRPETAADLPAANRKRRRRPNKAKTGGQQANGPAAAVAASNAYRGPKRKPQPARWSPLD